MSEVLERFKGKSFEAAEAELKARMMLFIMSEDADLVWIAKGYHHDGSEPGMAGLLAILCLRELGVAQTVYKAVALYRKAVEDHERKTRSRLDAVRADLMSLEEWLAWSSRCRVGPGQEKPWPIEPKWRKPEKFCGLANIMLFLASREIGIEGAETTDILAANGIRHFLMARHKYCEAKRRAA